VNKIVLVFAVNKSFIATQTSAVFSLTCS